MTGNNLPMYLPTPGPMNFPTLHIAIKLFNISKYNNQYEGKFILKFDNDIRGHSQPANNDKSITITHKINKINFDYITINDKSSSCHRFWWSINDVKTRFLTGKYMYSFLKHIHMQTFISFMPCQHVYEHL